VNIQVPTQLFAYTLLVHVCDLRTVNNTFWLHTERVCAQ